MVPGAPPIGGGQIGAPGGFGWPPPPTGAGPGLSPPGPGMGQFGSPPPGQGFGGPPPPGGVSYPGALQPAMGAAPGGAAGNFVEDFASLQLGGGGPGGDQGVDPATFPRPGDDIPNPNSDLSCDPRYLRLTCGALPVNQSVKQRTACP